MSDMIDQIKKFLGVEIALFALGLICGAVATDWYLGKEYESRTKSLNETISARNQEIVHLQEQLKSSHQARADKTSLEIETLRAWTEQCDAERRKLREYNAQWEQSYVELQAIERATQLQCVQSNAALKSDRDWLKEREKALRSQIANNGRLVAGQRSQLGEAQVLCAQYERGENFYGGASADKCVAAGKIKEAIGALEKSIDADRKELATIQQSLFSAVGQTKE